MGDLNTLLSHFSMTEIVIFAFALAGALKGAMELWDYFYSKLLNYFKKDQQKATNLETISEQLNALTDSQARLDEEIQVFTQSHNLLEEKLNKEFQELSSAQEEQRGELNEQLNTISSNLKRIQKETTNMQNRMQDDTRSYIIDKYRRYVCEKKSIDEVSLEDIERHYMYYTAEDGDQYISNLMIKIRALPIEVPEVAMTADYKE